MYTKEESVDFIENVLKIEDPLAMFEENPLGLLNCLLRAFHNAIPSQNVTLLAVDEENRRAQTIDDVKRAGLTGVGGICMVNNGFLKFLLEAIGFDVEFVPSDVIYLNHHFVVIASKVLRGGDQYFL